MDPHATIHSDEIIGEVFRNLVTDMGNNLGDQRIFASYLAGGIKEWRKIPPYKIPRYADPYYVKVRRQVDGFLKRCIFSEDLSDNELNKVTNNAYLVNQNRLGVQFRTYRSDIVIRRARSFVRQVLGKYNEDDIHLLCRFSRNAVRGYSFHDIYLDRKIHTSNELPNSAPITGTRPEIHWFKNYMGGDMLLAKSLRGRAYEEVSHLVQTNVPKSYKIKRPVKPNTLIGSFRSYGLGKLVARKLLDFGINLNRLQGKHRYKAKMSSRHRRFVTADLSSASDNFQPHLLNMLLPREWYNALKLGRTPYYRMGNGGKVFYSPSFMAMGIGFTFPVQSLLFHALIWAICDILGVNCNGVSVFGDDLIYPTEIHNYVRATFQDLGFVLNEDKTFVTECFRESCGGDFFDEIDCRPAAPEEMPRVLKGISVLALVHKLYNSLARRWEQDEFRLTAEYLFSVASKFNDELFFVPPYFPDESGFKVRDVPPKYIFKVAKRDVGCFKAHVSNWQPHASVKCVIDTTKYRRVIAQGIFLWEKLQCQPRSQCDWSTGMKLESTDRLVWRSMRFTRVVQATGKKKQKDPKRLVAFTSRKGSRDFVIGYMKVRH